MVLLHGAIVVRIYEGKDLPAADSNGLSDPYITVDFDHDRRVKTDVIEKTLNPTWNEEHIILLCGEEYHKIILCCKDDDFVGSDKLGYVIFDLNEIFQIEETTEHGPKRKAVSGWFELMKRKHDLLNKKSEGSIRIHMEYYEYGVGHEVLYCHSPMRENNEVTLYQDAHVSKGELPTVHLTESNQDYENATLWKDIYYSMCNAKKFIYITGWAVWTETVLVRDEDVESKTGYSPNLGKLLTAKIKEGVTVCCLAWNEKLSLRSSIVDHDGVMLTHDEETREYFEALEMPNVKIKLATRYGSQGVVTKYWFTHHQKTVICDAEAKSNEKRKIISYCGGLDLTDARYDSPKHHLFRTLQTLHKDDFHNVWEIGQERGPREPWHDIHAAVHGPAARDILTNFLQRWNKEGYKYVDVLYNIDGDEEIMSIEEEAKETKNQLNEKERWNVQMFRSIDDSSAVFPEGFYQKIDKSIHLAYLHHIRRAEKFIYIENQYFLGSCKFWERHTNIGCENLIPIEITKKIISKIKAGERFMAYIVVPMHPEGIPEESAIQEILRWERATMKMMYKRIGHALHEMNSHEHPMNYLRFFCLGNRETEEGSQATQSAEGGTPREELVCKNRNYYIYVHSKLMIVDDEYCIIGSANINERSIGGDRDTEICTGSYQPEYTVKNGITPKGQVYGFRKSLFHEHLNIEDAVFEEPWSLDCVKRIGDIADRNWDLYAQEEVVELDSHLLTYPMDIDKMGKISYVTRGKYFPNTKALIKGSSQMGIPDTITI